MTKIDLPISKFDLNEISYLQKSKEISIHVSNLTENPILISNIQRSNDDIKVIGDSRFYPFGKKCIIKLYIKPSNSGVFNETIKLKGNFNTSTVNIKYSVKRDVINTRNIKHN